jgi:predicted DNA-binding transcriptional regulator AlpA
MNAEHHAAEAPRYARTSRVQAMFDLSPSTLRTLVREGALSPPVAMSRKLYLWDLAEIGQLIEQRRRAAA